MRTPQQDSIRTLWGVRLCPRRGSGFAWLFFALLAAGCQEKSQAPLDIERLAFVPAGQTTIAGATLGARADLLVDRFEITRSEWQAFLDDQKGTGTVIRSTDVLGGEWRNGEGEWPATGMNLLQAEAFAATRTMRLPLASEWLWVASGSRGRAYPYDIAPRDSAANTLGLGLDSPTPVGTFYNGQTPGEGVFDLEGNVAEWVLVDRSLGPHWKPRGASATAGDGGMAWAMGGSYLSYSRPLYRFERDRIEVNAVAISPEYRSTDLGFRCVVDAGEWLAGNRERLSSGRYRTRMIKVGEGWGPRAVDLLLGLQREFPESALWAWLLEGARGA